MTIEWENEIREIEKTGQNAGWEDVLNFYGNRGIREDIEKGNITVLDESVWMEIDVCGLLRFRKVKAISNFTVYYDGTYHNAYTSYQLGSLDHIFRIDCHMLDLRHLPENTEKTKQELLLDFINTYAGVLDNRLPPVPKGILKV